MVTIEQNKRFLKAKIAVILALITAMMGYGAISAFTAFDPDNALSSAYAAFPEGVGALTEFDPNNTLDLATYCDGTDELDDLSCTRQWLNDAKAQGKHLYVSPGTYYQSQNLVHFSGMHLRCADPNTAVFKKVASTSLPLFGNYDDQNRHDVSIENCGFDMNGDTQEFTYSILIRANAEANTNITIRGNRFFDSTGMKSANRRHQRQHLVVMNVNDILVENNSLYNGGRIKLGGPGRRMIIRNNTLDFINDNGITIVDTQRAAIDTITEDVLIEGNTIVDPTVTGIFFGADGQSNGSGVTVRRVTIRNNMIVGSMGKCITGVMPDHASEIHIDNNTCHKKIGVSDEYYDDIYNTGIALNRSIAPIGVVENVTVSNNYVTSEQQGNLDSGAYYLHTGDVCYINNVALNNTDPLRAQVNTSVHLAGNDWGGYTPRIYGTVDEDVSGCYFSPLVQTSSPTVSLAASPTTIESGQSSTLIWNSTNANTCLASGFTASGTSGSAIVSPTQTTTYTIACTGTGGTASSSATVMVTEPQDTTPPSITSVTAGSIQQSSVTITWTTDELATSQVAYGTSQSYTNITTETQILTTNHSVSLSNLSSGTTYHFQVRSRDEAGNSAASADHTFTTLNAPDTTAPEVTITSPTNGATVQGSISISANATDPTVAGQTASGVAGVQFKLNGTNIGTEDTTSPYTTGLDTTTLDNGSHTLTAVARDNAGNTATSSTVTITVDNPDLIAPSVSITYPSNNSTVKTRKSINIMAAATDNVGVNKVEFSINNTLKCTDTTAPYFCSLSVPSTRKAKYNISAKAYDAAGNTAIHTITVTAN